MVNQNSFLKFISCYEESNYRLIHISKMYIGKYYPQRPLYIQRTFLLCRYTLTYFHVACNLSRLDFFKFVLIRSINIARIRRYTVMYHLAQTVFHVYFLQLPLALSQLCCCHVIIIKEIMKYSMINS